jgi:hypothetical protein
MFTLQPEQPTVLYFGSDLAFTSDGFSIKQMFETKKMQFKMVMKLLIADFTN